MRGWMPPRHHPVRLCRVPGDSPVVCPVHLHPATPTQQSCVGSHGIAIHTIVQALLLTPPARTTGPAVRKTIKRPTGPGNGDWIVTHRQRHMLLSVPPAKEYCPGILLSPGGREESCLQPVQLAGTLCLFQSRSYLQNHISLPHPRCIAVLTTEKAECRDIQSSPCPATQAGTDNAARHSLKPAGFCMKGPQ